MYAKSGVAGTIDPRANHEKRFGTMTGSKSKHCKKENNNTHTLIFFLTLISLNGWFIHSPTRQTMFIPEVTALLD